MEIFDDDFGFSLSHTLILQLTKILFPYIAL